MTALHSPDVDLRTLVLAPRGRDADVIIAVLAQAEMSAMACDGLDDLVDRLEEGAALVFVTEEVLGEGDTKRVKSWLSGQPSWSDLPLIVLAQKQARRSTQARASLTALGNMVLLERPLNAESLVSAAESALRSRRRQYQARGHLEEQARINREIERLYVAERNALVEAARAREALTLALDAAELGTFHCPMPLGPVVWNATCKAHFWLPADAIIDMDKFYDLIHAEDRQRTRAAVTAAIEGRRPYDVEYRTVAADGRFRWLRAKGRAYFGDDGLPTRFDGITIDISAQKMLEDERERVVSVERAAREEAENISRIKDEFLATLSHELRTPLSAMLGWVYVLKRTTANLPDVKQGLEAIERNARSQSKLIDELLDMSRIIAGNLRLETQSLLPAVGIEAVIASLKPVADAKGVRLVGELDPEAGPVLADADRLAQITSNLLSNAIRFTPDGGRVTVRLGTEDRQLVLEVLDTGEGISKDFLPLVFERFRQGDGSTTRRHGGLGLGLAIVRHLTELHGGTVAAHSDGPGHGARFTVRIPLAQTAVGAPARETEPAQSFTAGKGDLAGLRIVLVDDENDAREVLTRILSDCGADIVAVESANAALSVLQDREADLLISDIGMPNVDGFQLLQQVRALGHQLPAIALTAFARSEDAARALAAGFELHLAKPVEPQTLVASAATVSRSRSPIGRTSGRC